jgi:hypothetical protein
MPFTAQPKHASIRVLQFSKSLLRRKEQSLAKQFICKGMEPMSGVEPLTY